LQGREELKMANGDVATSTSKGKTSVSKTKAKAKDVNQRLRKAQRAAILLKQASDPTRLQIMLTLADGEKHVGALCLELNQTQPAVSHHLALLRHGGLISPRRQGKNNYYSLTDPGMELAKVVRGIVA
jgi:DNA-binding transcriptional ArsR family regulator